MWFEKSEKGVITRIRLAPNSSSDEIGSVFEDSNNVFWLKAKVTKVPENGKANKALLDLLSKKLKIPKTAFKIIQGELDRNKVLLVDNLYAEKFTLSLFVLETSS